MSDFQLGEEQLAALELLKQSIKDRTPCCTVVGKPGVGKSRTIAALVEYLESQGINYCLCAPTHKAALVMQRFANRDAMTLHSMLSLSPQLDIFALDFNNLLFKTGKAQLQIPQDGVVILDEISMINDDLYDLLLKRCKEYNAVIAAFGDSCQIQPVKGSGVAKIMNCPVKAELTKVYRQGAGNPLLPVLEELRVKSKKSFSTKKGEEGNIIVTNDIKQFVTTAINQAKKAMELQDVLHSKVTAYKNATVDAYNSVIHRAIAKDEEYIKGEFLTAYENLEFNDYKLYNSMDYIIFEEPKRKEIRIPGCGTFPGYSLVLLDPLTKVKIPVPILSREVSDEDLTKLAAKIESKRLNALDNKANKFKANQFWREYFQILKSFTTPKDLYWDGRLIRKKSFDYGYAATTHKLQGSTLVNVFVDIKDLNTCYDENVKRQLQYVALSRPRKNCIIYQ